MLKIILIFSFSLLSFLNSSFAQETANCGIYVLGSGQDNIWVSNFNINLKKSPITSSLIGSAQIKIPTIALPENQTVSKNKMTNTLNISLRLADGKSTWSKEKAKLTAQLEIYNQDELLAHAESNSDTLHNASDLRLLESNKTSLVKRIQSPAIYKTVTKLNKKILEIDGFKVSVKEVLLELGYETTVEHLAQRNIIKPEEVSSWMINCSVN